MEHFKTIGNGKDLDPGPNLEGPGGWRTFGWLGGDVKLGLEITRSPAEKLPSDGSSDSRGSKFQEVL